FSAPSLLTNIAGTIYGVYNTTVGSNSLAATVGVSNPGQYPSGQGPSSALDGNTGTKYLNDGPCGSAASLAVCGVNSGLYFQLSTSVVIVELQICTGDDLPTRDPLTVSLEGSNQTGSALTLGSSWFLIYNGNSGLQSDPGRMACGTIQLFINAISYTSYRFLVASKRGVDIGVQYSEIYLFYQ
ncbi:unnamed protein product, partial [Adineta steineri]